MRQHTIRRVQQKPRQFPAGQVRGLREQRELRTADRVLILRERSASGKTPGGPATASAKKARRMAGASLPFGPPKSGPSPTCLATSCPVNSPKMGSAIGRVQKENAAAVPLARCAVVRRRCALGHRRAANFCANQCGVQSAARRMPFTLCPAAAAPPSHEKAPPARVSRRGSALLFIRAGRPSFGGRTAACHPAPALRESASKKSRPVRALIILVSVSFSLADG